jgi:hypothetical protein
MIGVATVESGRARFCLVTGDEIAALKHAKHLRDLGAHGVEVIDLETLQAINAALADADANDLP